jgi:predicted nucleic acid-binding protein
MRTGPAVYILDSFALLAYLGGERGMARVREILANSTRGQCRACVSLISLGEVLYIIERERSLPKAQQALAAIEELPLEILPASRDAVLAAAHVKARFPISYADAFVVAAAQEQDAMIVTGDPEFAAVQSLVRIEWLPGSPHSPGRTD